MMKSNELESVLDTLGAKKSSGGAFFFPESANMTLHLCRDGVHLTIARVASLHCSNEAEWIFAHTQKKEVFGFARCDIFALSTEDPGQGEVARKAGFRV